MLKHPLLNLIAGLVLSVTFLASCTLPARRPVSTETPVPAATETAAPAATVSTETATPVISPTATNTAAPTPAPRPNLAANGSFEDGQYKYNGDLLVPFSWLPFGQAGCIHTELESHPPHVKDGAFSGRVFQVYNTCPGGFYQVISAVPGKAYQVIAWAYSWSTNKPVVGTPSDDWVQSWVGVDADGLTDPYSPTVYWSDPRAYRDTYGLLSLNVQARGDYITVFLKSAPNWALARSDTFWDQVAVYEVGP